MQFEPEFWWNWWVNVAIAIGTVGAVLYALFSSWIKEHFFPPKLTLELVRKYGEQTQLTYASQLGTYAGEAVALFFHLRVANSRRQSPARNVLVYLFRIEEHFAELGYKEVWTGNVPVRWRHPDIVRGPQIVGPHVDCDLFSLTAGETTFQELDHYKDPVIQRPALTIYPVSVPNNLRLYNEIRRKIAIRLWIEVRSNEIDSGPYVVNISWNGIFSLSADEIKNNLHLTITKS